MSKTHEYLNYLNEQIGIAPANSQEELQAAQTISEVMDDHGVNPVIEEFSTPTGNRAMKPISTLLMLLALIFAGFGGIAGTIGVLVAIACCILLIMGHHGKSPFKGMGPVVQSQNVVAFHQASGSKVMKGNRPIVIVAHYDTPRVNPILNQRGGASFYAWARKASAICLYVVAVAAFIQLLGFVPPVARRVFWFIGIIAALVPALLAIADIASRNGDCTDGANDNKSSVAALLSILNNVHPGPDVALDAEAVRAQQEEAEREREAARKAHEEEEAAAAEAEAAAKAKAEEERLARYKRHGVDTLKSLGMLPEGCTVVYEDPHVTIDKPVQQDEAVAESEAEEEPAPAETTVAEEKTEVRPVEPEAEGDNERPAKKGLGALFGRVRETFEERGKAEAEDGYDEYEEFEDKPEETSSEASAPSADEPAPEEGSTEDESDGDATIQSEPVKLDEEEPIDTEGKTAYEMSEDNPYQDTDFQSMQQLLWPDVLDADWEPIDTTTPEGMESDVPPSAASSVGEPHLRSQEEEPEEEHNEAEEAPASDSSEEELGEPQSEASDEEPAAEGEGEDAPFANEAPAVQEALPAEEPAVSQEPLPAEAASTVVDTPAIQEPAAQIAEEPAQDEASYLAHSSEDVAQYVDSIFAQEIDAANLSKAPGEEGEQGLASQEEPPASEPETAAAPKALQAEAPSATPSASPDARDEAPHHIDVDDSGVLAALASLDAEVPAPKDEEDEAVADRAPAAAAEAAPEAPQGASAPQEVASDLSSITPVVTESEIEDLSGWEPAEAASSEQEGLEDTDVFGAIPAEEDEHEENGDTAVFPAYEENDPLRYVSKSTPLDAYFEEIEEPEEDEEPEPADDTASFDLPAETSEASLDAEPAEGSEEDDRQDYEDEGLEGEDGEVHPSDDGTDEEPEASEPVQEERVDDAEALPEEDASSFVQEPSSIPEAIAEAEPSEDADTTDESKDYRSERLDEEELEDDLDDSQAGPNPLYPEVLDAELVEEIEESEAADEDAEEAEAADAEMAGGSEEEPWEDAEEMPAEEPESNPAPAQPADIESAPEPEVSEDIPEGAAEETEAVQDEIVPDVTDASEPETAASEEESLTASADEHLMDEATADAADAEEPAAEEEPAPEQPQTISDSSDLKPDADAESDDAEALPEETAEVEADAGLIEEDAVPAPREKPAMPDDPEWGKTTFKPAISQMSRRVILDDLPDPSRQSIDPFSEGSEEHEPHETPEVSMKSSTPQPVVQQSQFDVITPETLDRIAKESQREQKRHHFGRKPGQGRHFAATEQDALEASSIRAASPSRPHHGSNNGWKGGATPKEELREPGYGEDDEPEGVNGYELDPERAAAVRAQAKAEAEARARAQAKAEAEARAQAEAQAQQEREATIADEELRDAVLSMNDEDLTCHDIWFVAAGGSELDHAGMEAFLEEHRKELRGAFLINLDCIGAGTPTVLTEEGLDEPKRADRRLVRMFQNIAQDFGLPLAKRRYNVADTDATPALRKHVRSVTIMGMDENGLPAYSKTLDDVAQNVNGDQVADIVQMVTELIRQS